MQNLYIGYGTVDGMKRGTKKGANNSANVRNNDIKDSIVALLKDSDNPLSTSDLASKLGKAWHTIDRACLMLRIEEKIDGFKVGKMNLWRVK